jgi:hypothetical protein
MVFDHGLRDVEALPAGPTGAEAEIGVFAIEEEIVIEAADVVEHGAAEEGGGAGGHEDFFEDGEIFGEAAVSTLFAAAIAGDEHAGGIEARFAKEAHLGGAHAHIRAGGEGGEEVGEPLGVGDGVVIKGGDVGGGGGADALVDGGSEARVGGVFDDARTGGGTVAAYQASATVIDDQHFEIEPRLPGEGLHALQKPRIRSQGGDHHRYEVVRQFLILPCSGERDIVGTAGGSAEVDGTKPIGVQVVGGGLLFGRHMRVSPLPGYHAGGAVFEGVANK